MGVHGEEVRQGQGWQPEGQHLPHGTYSSTAENTAAAISSDLPPLQGGGLCILSILDRGGGRVLQVQGGAEACLLHLGHDLLLGALTFIVCNGHDTGGEFTSLRSTPGSFRVTRSTDALHAAQCIPEMSYFSSRIGTSNLPERYPSGVIFLRPTIYPWGYLPRGEFSAVKKCRGIRKPLDNRGTMV